MKTKKEGIVKIILPFVLAAAVLGGCGEGNRVAEFARNQAEEAKSRIQEAVGPEFQKETENTEELQKKYYYSLLGEEEQKIYRQLVQGIRDGKEEIVTYGNDPAQINDVCTWVFMDYPEFFWCSGSVETTGYTGISEYSKVRPEYTCSPEERTVRQEQIDAAAGQCLAGLPEEGSDYEKLRYLYTWIVEQTEYAADAPDNQNIYSVFGNRQSVCAGYSRAFQYLAEKAGITCLYVTGTVNAGESHAWNIVECDGAWYNVDVTFGDPVFLEQETQESGTGNPVDRVFYDYLCVSDGVFLRNHVPDTELVLPACDSTELEYYRRNGRYFEEASRSQMLELMQEDIARQDAWSDFKYADESAYQQAEEFLESVTDEAALYLCRLYGLSQTVYRYNLDPESLRITVYWEYS